jgi:hypothetical protein
MGMGKVCVVTAYSTAGGDEMTWSPELYDPTMPDKGVPGVTRAERIEMGRCVRCSCGRVFTTSPGLAGHLSRFTQHRMAAGEAERLVKMGLATRETRRVQTCG